MNSAKTAPSNLALADVAPAGTAAANSGISRAAAQPGARNVGASLPRRGAAAVLAILLAAFALGGCSSEPPVYTDGAYSGVSSLDDEGAYAEVDITIEEGKISACGFVTRQSDGSLKDADYGKVNGEVSNRDYYDKAQLAVAAMGQYADDLVETGDISQVDAITGATIAYDQFREAVADALHGAQQ